MNAWLLEKHTPLGEILCRRGAIDDDDRAAIDRLVLKHLLRHNGDAHASLAALHVRPEVLRPLVGLGDAEVCTSLNGTATPPNPAAWAAPRSAATAARYQRLHHHRSGGLGEVHVALDPELNREVALKQIQDRYADDPASRARFLREAQING